MDIKALEAWFLTYKRMLPWRKDKDPYHVWISEVMLQQTRIEAVIPYYERFMERLPDISSLAVVDDEVLLKLWEGLGYYNRARNLKKAAIMMMNQYGGRFPASYSDILLLPGIGEYTASAISSICFGERNVCVDGNVMRVFTRFYNDSSNISKKSTRQRISGVLLSMVEGDMGNFNEALMELGEVICLPNGIPKCELCPLHQQCQSYYNSNYFLYPVKTEKSMKEEILMTVYIPIWKNRVMVRKRKNIGLLRGLYEFPNVEGQLDSKDVCELALKFGKIENIQKSISYTHVFTHKKWKMQAYFVFFSEVVCSDCFYSLYRIENDFAIPTAFSPFLYQLKEELK